MRGIDVIREEKRGGGGGGESVLMKHEREEKLREGKCWREFMITLRGAR